LKCQFCEAKSIVHIELEPGRILELCEGHFDRLRNFLGAPSVTEPQVTVPPPTYWNVINLQDACQHEYDYGTAIPSCRKCGKLASPPNTTYIISSSHYRATLDP
jgi:hypothetical protein